MVAIYTEYIAPAREGQRGVAIQVIELEDSYMIWVGTTEATGAEDDVGRVVEQGRLCKDWACGVAGAGTVLCGGRGNAVGLARRVAGRVGKVVYVSVDAGSEEEEMAVEGAIMRWIGGKTDG